MDHGRWKDIIWLLSLGRSNGFKMEPEQFQTGNRMFGFSTSCPQRYTFLPRWRLKYRWLLSLIFNPLFEPDRVSYWVRPWLQWIVQDSALDWRLLLVVCPGFHPTPSHYHFLSWNPWRNIQGGKFCFVYSERERASSGPCFLLGKSKNWSSSHGQTSPEVLSLGSSPNFCSIPAPSPRHASSNKWKVLVCIQVVLPHPKCQQLRNGTQERGESQWLSDLCCSSWDNWAALWDGGSVHREMDMSRRAFSTQFHKSLGSAQKEAQSRGEAVLGVLCVSSQPFPLCIK